MIIKLKQYKQKLISKLWRLYRIYLAPCTLEIHLADHCNINCVSCNHYSPLSEKSFLDFNSFETNINYLKGLKLNFRLLGGEPLLNPQIESYIILLRKYFPKSKIEIITNGLLLQESKRNNLSPTFFNTCRLNDARILITKYPINVDYEKIIDNLKLERVKFKVFGNHLNRDGFFRYTINNDKKDPNINFRKCNDISCLQLKDDKIYGCAPAAYIDILNKKYNTQFKITSKDFLDIKEIKSLKDIIKFRSESKPFCGYCVFPRKKIEWTVSRRDPEEWIENSPRNTGS